jgi:hypothetical protein
MATVKKYILQTVYIKEDNIAQVASGTFVKTSITNGMDNGKKESE